MKNHYRIGEVEEILGVPRSTIQYYIRKGYLNINKDSNGYRYYTRSDMREILHLIIGRSNIRLNLDESVQRTEVESLGEFRRLFYHQEDFLVRRIKEDRRSIEIIQIYYRMLNRIERYENRYTILQMKEIYFFPERYIFQAHTTIIDTGFVTSIFEREKDGVSFRKAGSVVFNEDRFLLSDEDFAKKEMTFPWQSYLYTVVRTTKDIEDPTVVLPALNYAEEQGIALDSHAILCNLFRIEENGEMIYYYDLYLPIQENEK